MVEIVQMILIFHDIQGVLFPGLKQVNTLALYVRAAFFPQNSPPFSNLVESDPKFPNPRLSPSPIDPANASPLGC